MKVAIISSHEYKEKVLAYGKELVSKYGYEVFFPAWDSHPELDELGICEHNKKNIKSADRIDIFWDQRSLGTVFDFGMTFMADKPIKIIYIESKTFKGVMEKYAEKWLKPLVI